MAKTLLLLRHAKTEHRDYDSDHERELTPRGERQSGYIGAYLKDAGVMPVRIISSSAARARATAEICGEAAGFSGTIEIEDELYGLTADRLIQFINSLDNSGETILLVGHNPAFEEVASVLAGRIIALGTGDCARFSVASAGWDVPGDGVSVELNEIIQSD